MDDSRGPDGYPFRPDGLHQWDRGDRGTPVGHGFGHGFEPEEASLFTKFIKAAGPYAREAIRKAKDLGYSNFRQTPILTSYHDESMLLRMGYLSYAGITLLSPNEDDRSSFSAKFEDWLIEKGLEHFSEHLLPSFLPRMVVLTLRTVEANSEPVLDQLQKISRSLSCIEGNSAESVRLLEKIASAVGAVESQVSDGVKSVKEAVGNDPEKPLPETVLSEFVKKLRAVNSGQFSQLLTELEKLAATASIPGKLKKQLTELKIELQKGRWMIITFGTTLAGNALEKPDPSKAKPSTPGNPNPLAPPTLVVPTASPPIPFAKFGKRALDVLYGGFVENPLHAEVQCGFKLGTQIFPAKIGNPCYPSVLTKIKSSPEFSVLMKHKQLCGDGVKGAVSFVHPCGTTSMAKVQYLNEKFSLNAEMGLRINPSMKILGSYNWKGLCGGGAVTFGARDGRITGFEAGVSASNPEWGILSGKAKMLRNPENRELKGLAVKILYSQDVMQKNTIAADVGYNYDDSTIVITAGVEHRVDDSMLLKGRVSTDGAVAFMVQFKEGLAGSTFRAMVQANVFSLEKPPRVGFSITSDPTK